MPPPVAGVLLWKIPRCILSAEASALGRVSMPKAPSPIHLVLDKFLCEIPIKARDSSWHRKAALLRFTLSDCAGTGESPWRLWSGSRNLTKSMNLEAEWR
jgi:hypothetical protein